MEQSEYTGFEIAIIGMSGLFPNNTDMTNLWNKLANGEELITFFTDEEILKAGISEELVNNPNFIKANSYIREREYFDSAFFEYSPDEVLLMDPQMRLFHQCVYEALESAGYDPYTYDDKIGLFAGASDCLNWQVFATIANNENVDRLSVVTLANNQFMPTRISHKLNLKGPSISVYTACSTSLVAICNACNNLLLGESKIAVAGASKLFESSVRGYMYEEGLINSPDGHCRAFSADSKGTVPAEGVGVVVLKRLQDAIDENDNVLAVIKGYGLNNDGSGKQGYVSTSPNGQAEAIHIAQKMAGVSPESISYIEAHGTGTEIGDPIEVEALTKVFGKTKEKYCALGSIKTNLGHMDSSAGVGGVIKTVLALQNRQIPPSINFDKPNPKIDFENSPFYVNTQLKEWKNDKYPLRAGVSSFGIGGTNAHIILEEAPGQKTNTQGRLYKNIQISGKTESALYRNIEKFKIFLTEENSSFNLADAAYSLQTGRGSFANRAVFTCKDIDELRAKLNANPSQYKTGVVKKEGQKITFMFSGQGAQYMNMCKGLYDHEVEFRVLIDKGLDDLKNLTGKNFHKILFGSDSLNESEINKTINTQPLLFLIEYAIAKVFISWGITPDYLIGHSIGEYAAACISGVFDFNDALRLVVKRGELMQGVESGSMLSVSLTENELNELLESYQNIDIAANNSDLHWVVSGENHRIEDFMNFLEKQGYPSQMLKTSHAFHSSMMDGILDHFSQEVAKTKINEPKIPIISNLTGNIIDFDLIRKPEYWSKHLRSTVQFAKGIKNILNENKEAVFIEVGPGRSLSTFVRNNKQKGAGHKIYNILRHPKEEIDDNEFLMSKLGDLWLAGVNLNYESYYKNEPHKKIALPTYSFEKIPYITDINVFRLINESTKGDSGDHSFEERLTNQITKVLKSQKEYKSERPSISSNFEAPKNEMEVRMSELWQKLFGISDIGINDDFFELGGDSLRATTMINRVYKEFGEEVSLKSFFANPTINGILESINNKEKIEYIEIVNLEKKEYYPMSPAQKRLYLLQQMELNSLAYNMPYFIPLNPEISKDDIEDIFKRLIERHESLRTSFVTIREEAVQRIYDTFDFRVQEYTEENSDYNELRNKYVTPFDLSVAPLIRVSILNIKGDKRLLLVDMHHIITDGVTQVILEAEFAKLYAKERIPPLRVQYKEFSKWQNERSLQQVIKKQEEFWLNHFKEEISLLNLPTDYSRSSYPNHEGAFVRFELNHDETSIVKNLAKNNSLTLYMSLLSVYTLLLSKLSGQDEIIIGTPIAGRNHADLEKIVGMFVNTLALKQKINSNSNLEDFLSVLKQTTLNALENQDYQFEELVEKLSIERNINRNPIFDVMFNLHNQQDSDRSYSKADLNIHKNSQSKFDLTLNAVDFEDSILMELEYKTSLFKAESIDKFIEYFKNIINYIGKKGADSRIRDIQIVSDQVKSKKLTEFNKDIIFEIEGGTIQQRLSGGYKDFKDKVAIEKGNCHITYSELQIRKNYVAHGIHSKNISKGELIGIYVNEKIDFIYSLLGTLDVGCIFVPLDPQLPIKRIKTMVDIIGIKDFIVSVENQNKLNEIIGENSNFIVLEDCYDNDLNKTIPIDCSKEDKAYVYFTSGSSGTPKPIIGKNESLLQFIDWEISKFKIDSSIRVSQLVNVGFDASLRDIFVPLIAGGTLCMLADNNLIFDGFQLPEWIDKRHISLIHCVPSVFKIFNHENIIKDSYKSLQNVLLSGEQILPSILENWYNKIGDRVQLTNLYGSTETTMVKTCYYIKPSDVSRRRIPIGDPMKGSAMIILDKDKNVCDIGLPGELYIRTAYSTYGYFNRETEIKEKFLSNPYHDDDIKIYASGDLAVENSNGEIEILGRLDRQDKIGGVRIEYGEIENVIQDCNNIKDCIVESKLIGGDKIICAYIIVNSDFEIEVLKSLLRERLPEYMIPKHFIKMTSFPLTSNGKINRKELPLPKFELSSEIVAPVNEIEERLLEICSNILKLNKESISMEANFFDLGGDSFKVMILMQRIKKEFNVSIQVREFFSMPYLKNIANLVSGSLVEEYDGEEVEI